MLYILKRPRNTFWTLSEGGADQSWMLLWTCELISIALHAPGNSQFGFKHGSQAFTLLSTNVITGGNDCIVHLFSVLFETGRHIFFICWIHNKQIEHSGWPSAIMTSFNAIYASSNLAGACSDVTCLNKSMHFPAVLETESWISSCLDHSHRSLHDWLAPFSDFDQKLL